MASEDGEVIENKFKTLSNFLVRWAAIIWLHYWQFKGRSTIEQNSAANVILRLDYKWHITALSEDELLVFASHLLECDPVSRHSFHSKISGSTQ